MAYSYRNKVGHITATFIAEQREKTGFSAWWCESTAVEIEVERDGIVRYETLHMSVEEARDLQYLLGRLIAHAEEKT